MVFNRPKIGMRRGTHTYHKRPNLQRVEAVKPGRVVQKLGLPDVGALPRHSQHVAEPGLAVALAWIPVAVLHVAHTPHNCGKRNPSAKWLI